MVRNTIKQFAQAKVTLPPGRHKVVILDEADRCRSHGPPCMGLERAMRGGAENSLCGPLTLCLGKSCAA